MKEIMSLLKVIDRLQQSYSIKFYHDYSGIIFENDTNDEIFFKNLKEAKSFLTSIIINSTTNF